MSAPTVWICSYLPQNVGAGVERFVKSLSDIVKDAGYLSRIVDLSSIQLDRTNLGRFRYLAAWRIGKFVNAHASADDIIVCNNFFSWNARKRRSVVVFHGTDKGRATHNKSNMSPCRRLAVGTIGANLERLTGNGRMVVAVSNAVKGEIETYYHLHVDEVIPNAVDLRLFRPREDKQSLRQQLGLPQEKFLLLYVGTPERRKGLGWLLESLLPKLSKDKQLVLRSDVIKPPKDVIIVKRLPIERLAELYAACDAFVFPTSYEGCSYSLIEALASGLPPITSPTGGGRDLLTDPKLSEYVTERLDVVRYIECIERLAASRNEWAATSKASRSFAERNHDMERFRRAYLSIISRLAQ